MAYSSRQENLTNLKESLQHVKLIQVVKDELTEVAEDAKVLVGFELLELSKKSKKLAKRFLN